jgi:hypothetical protein
VTLSRDDQEAGRRGGDPERDQRVREHCVRGVEAEVARRPDPDHLEEPQGPPEVAELRPARERPVVRAAEELAGGEPRGQGEERAGGDREQRSLPQQHDRCDERRDEPHRARGTEHVQQRGCSDSERERAAGGDERSDGRDQRGGGHFLDPGPERVGVEQRGLRGGEEADGPHRPRPDDRPRQSVQGEREHRSGEVDRRLEEPRDVLPDEDVPDPERHQRADRVPVGEVDVDHPLVRRGLKAREIAAVLHHTIGEAEERRGVVQRDVPRERRVPRQEDRGAEDREDHDGERDGPPVDGDTASAREHEPRRSPGDDQRCRRLCGHVVCGRQRRDHDHRREAGGEEERARQGASGTFHQQAATETEETERERVERPADEEAHRGDDRESARLD